jgi:hypothetical protein
LLADAPQRCRLALGGYRKVVADFDRSANIPALAALFAGTARVSAYLDNAAVASNAAGDNGSGDAAHVAPRTLDVAPPDAEHQ